MPLHELLDAVGESMSSGWERANCIKAVCNSPGRVRPRFSLRLMIPAAARADSENLGGASLIRISLKVEGEDEHPSSSLGHSGEPLRVQYPEGPPIACVPQSTE
jgi:hypothetical protein